MDLFEKLRKTIIGISCFFVLPSVCMKQLGSHWTDFYEMW